MMMTKPRFDCRGFFFSLLPGYEKAPGLTRGYHGFCDYRQNALNVDRVIWKTRNLYCWPGRDRKYRLHS